MTNATSSLQLVPLYVPAAIIADTYADGVMDSVNQSLLVSYTRWGVLRALLVLISCGISIHFVFYNLFSF